MELELIDWLRERCPPSPRIPLSVGDDAAILRISAGRQAVVTTDMLMDGVDFLLEKHSPEQIGRKALAVNLSDLAAMAAHPVAAFVSFALPKSAGPELPRELINGMLPLAEQFACPLAGGDTNTWNDKLVISVTAIGEAEPGKAWRRSGAQPGDILLATGSFGGSILGHHFDFQPRLAEAQWLAERFNVHAAIDVSDGLSLDLWRMTQASGCGAELWPEVVPLTAAAKEVAKHDGRKPLDHALSDGEDFELLLCLSPEDAHRLRLMTWPFDVPRTCIGQIVPQPGLWVREQGNLISLLPQGFVHGG